MRVDQWIAEAPSMELHNFVRRRELAGRCVLWGARSGDWQVGSTEDRIIQDIHRELLARAIQRQPALEFLGRMLARFNEAADRQYRYSLDA